jgi:hypothetical protein
VKVTEGEEIENSRKMLTSFLKKKKEKDVKSDDYNEGSSADIVEERDIWKKKSESAQEETFANTLAPQDIVEETVPPAQQTHRSCQEGMKKNKSMAVRI